MLKEAIEVAKLAKKADILLKGAKIVNVFSGEVYSTNVAIYQDRIVGVGNEYQRAKKVINLRGKYILPGLIDAHLHIESSLLSPAQFTKAVVPHGTTTVVIDPHEIANVVGVKGIKYMLSASRNLPLDVFIMASSCVPATAMETAGAFIGAGEIGKLLKLPRVLGLAELMNYPGVIFEVPSVLRKVEITQKSNKVIDGHAPLLAGPYLQAYLNAQVSSDHECTNKKEALEKLRLGMYIMVREGSAAKNLASLLPLVNKGNSRRFLFATDDRHPDDLAKEGHIDNILRKAVRSKCDPVEAVRMATLNTAQYFGLKNTGAIAPGYLADLVAVNNLKDFKPTHVFKGGKLVAKNGKMMVAIPTHKDSSVIKTVKVKPLEEKDLQIKIPSGKARVIGLVANQIVTKNLAKKVKTQNNLFVVDIKSDILKIAVVERHKKTGNIGLGLIQGFGLSKGALASSVAHDSHNIIVVGTNDADMIKAIKQVVKMDGGYVVVKDGKALASLKLPIAGLMSNQPLNEVNKALNKLRKESRKLGTRITNPFITLSFCALPVIPELKLTDKGLVDVNKFRLVSLEVK